MLTGYEYFHAFELGNNSVGNLGDIYAELLRVSVVDDNGKQMFTAESVKKLPHFILNTLGGEILAVHNKYSSELEDSGVFKFVPTG
jgi:hypothetical protein